MRRRPEAQTRFRAWAVSAAALAAATLSFPFSPLRVVPPVMGQQGTPIELELAEALSRAGPAERVPVLIEVERESPPLPVAFDRDLRAVEQASNLANLYTVSAERLRRALPSDVAFDLAAARLLWIGGAIAAELTASQIESLESQPSVRRVYYDGLVEVGLSGGDEAAPTPMFWAPGFPTVQDPAGGLPWGLEAIGAPEMWAAGASGQGSVIAIIDSGVDGTHPLLRRKWRGLSTTPEEGWFDPWGLTAVPVDDDRTAGVGHGTLVAETAVGGLEPGDTLLGSGGSVRVVEGEFEVVTGVAPGAEWVAVNAFESFGGASYTRRSVLLQAMQWVLDPDGDPGTISDVPDVVNNSWGFRADGCDGVFDRAIDALELSGIPVVFAAGNRSPGFDTVATPANRADLLLNAFSVGAAVQQGDEIVVADNSLGGPSPCAPGAVKPEVVSPGIIPVVRAVGPNTAEVRGRTGAFTSWATPYVSGSLAVLRGLNASASSNDLKDALFSTAEDLPPPGLDNRSGAGFIDLPAAANRVGGLGAVRVDVAGWSWDSASAALTLDLFNAGDAAFPGGDARLANRGGRLALAYAAAPMIPARSRGAITFERLRLDVGARARLTLRLESPEGRLDLPVTLGSASASSARLEDGAVQLSLDANGRIGRVAGSPGFLFMGRDWLPGGSFLVAVGDRVSDAAYVDVLQRQVLKPNPVGSDTDWRGSVVFQESAAVELEYSDRHALRPVDAAVTQSVTLTSIADTAAFAVLAITPSFGERDGAPMAGLLLDWDLGQRDSVFWDGGLGASVMTGTDPAAPWVALTVMPRPPTIHAAVPLGNVVIGGFYETGRDAGVLSDLQGFTDDEKGRLLRLGGDQVSDARISDWAHLVAMGPMRSGEPLTFVIAAAASRSALGATLDSARAFVEASGLTEPAGSGSRRLQLLPAYPNPFDPNAVDAVNLPFLVIRGGAPVQATLEIFTISGRRVFREQRLLAPDVPVEPFRWTGRLGGGQAAATGVYGYVIRVGDERVSGKFVLLK